MCGVTERWISLLYSPAIIPGGWPGSKHNELFHSMEPNHLVSSPKPVFHWWKVRGALLTRLRYPQEWRSRSLPCIRCFGFCPGNGTAAAWVALPSRTSLCHVLVFSPRKTTASSRARLLSHASSIRCFCFLLLRLLSVAVCSVNQCLAWVWLRFFFFPLVILLWFSNASELQGFDSYGFWS